MPRCVSNRCKSGRIACPTPIDCGISPPDVPKLIGEDESGPYERLEGSDWVGIASGVIKAVVAVLVLLLALFAASEIRSWYDAKRAGMVVGK